ncbi:MAG: S41 family peptidase [Myxococcota bacterium]
MRFFGLVLVVAAALPGVHTLQEHSRTLQEHSGTLQEHSQTLQEHSGAGAKVGLADDRPHSGGAETLSAEEAASDLRSWLARVERVHPFGTDVIRSRLAVPVAEAIARLPKRLDRLEFFALASPIAARLQDSHTFISPPTTGASVALPRLVVEGDSVLLQESLPPLKVGDRIDEIAGYDTERLISLALPWVASEHSKGARVGSAAFLPTALRVEGVHGPVRLRAGGREVDYVPTRTWSPPPAIEVRQLRNRVFLATIRTFAASEGFYLRSFERLFRAIHDEAATGLVIDLRENDGGNTTVGSLLLSYVTQRPYRLFGAKRWRVSREMQEQIEQSGVEGFEEYLRANVGEWVNAVPTTKVFHEPAMRFDGPTVFLIGPRTRSAAMMVANAVEDFKLGLLVGRPPLSPPKYCGEVHSYRMSKSGLNAAISSASFTRANGDASNQRRVQPDILVKRSEQRSELAVALAAIAHYHSQKP